MDLPIATPDAPAPDDTATAAPAPSGQFTRRSADDARSEKALFAALTAGDPNARERLVERFLPLARRIARRYDRGDEPFDDLLQVASMGLLKAIDRFDPERGLAFSSFAVPTITGEVRRHFRDRTWSVRVPRGLQELSLEIDAQSRKLRTELQRSPTVHELAHAIGRSEEEVLEGLHARGAYRATSFETPQPGGDEDGATLGDSLGVLDDEYTRAEERATLGSLMSSLSERDRAILRMRFEEDMTQSEIADVIGVSQMQVSRLIRRSLERLSSQAAAG